MTKQPEPKITTATAAARKAIELRLADRRSDLIAYGMAHTDATMSDDNYYNSGRARLALDRITDTNREIGLLELALAEFAEKDADNE